MYNFINNKYFSNEWINQKKEELQGDPVLIEKAIYAFNLLGYLTQTGIDFVFKGGTSLLLHIENIKRLSIDIDIIYGEKESDLVEKLEQIAKIAPFIRYEEDNRGERGLPNRRHFKFFYISSLTGVEDSILLDVVLDSTDYLKFTETKLIKSILFKTEREISVKTLTPEELLGDKLTAFAPHTIGVPFETSKGKSMTLQVVKQLFDLGELFDISYDFDKVKIAFQETYKKEDSYHGNKYSEDVVLEDTINICHHICLSYFKGSTKKADIDNIGDGLKKISSHLLFGVKFSIHNEVKIAAAKVFHIAYSILHDNNPNISKERFSASKIEEIKGKTLPAPYNYLNKLITVLPEAFYYIWKAVEE